MTRGFGVGLVSTFQKYLGSPVLQPRSNHKQFYMDLVNKIKAKLQGWKVSLLSQKAGRLILCQAVLSSLPLYQMSSILVPDKYANEISISRFRLWYGDTDHIRKLHLMDWRQLCLRKSAGALGLKRRDVLNKEITAKAEVSMVQMCFSCMRYNMFC